MMACAVGLWALGTIDDRLNLSPLLRVALQTGVAVVPTMYATTSTP